VVSPLRAQLVDVVFDGASAVIKERLRPVSVVRLLAVEP